MRRDYTDIRRNDNQVRTRIESRARADLSKKCLGKVKVEKVTDRRGLCYFVVEWFVSFQDPIGSHSNKVTEPESGHVPRLKRLLVILGTESVC